MNNDQPMKAMSPEPKVDSNPNRLCTQRKSWRTRLGLVVVALSATVALGAIIMNCFIPRLPDRAQGITERVGWYVQHGQLQADVRTLGAALHYLIQSDHEIPGVATSTNPVVAGHPTPDAPKS
jgi:hypothetical protein